jgi:hypothetical protein
LAIVALFDDLGGQLGGSGRAKQQSGTGANAFSGAEEDPPAPFRGGVEQQNFHGTTSDGLRSEQASGYYPGIIKNQEISGMEEGREV